MKIVPNIFTNYVTNKNHPCFKTNFKGSPAIDSFVIRSPHNVIIGADGHYIKGRTIKNIKLKNKESGESVDGIIFKTDTDFKDQYHVSTDGLSQCRMVFFKDVEDKSIFIDQLYGEKNQGRLKGAGTELLKYAIEESKKNGYHGKITLIMAGSFPFYYKNNFRINNKKSKIANIQNAALDYIVRENVETGKLWRPEWSTPVVELSPENAEKTLRSERLIDTSKSKVLYTKKMDIGENGKEIDMDFCDLGNTFVLQIINKSAKRCAQLATLEGIIKDGKLIPTRIKVGGFKKYKECIKDEFRHALELARKEYSKT